MKQFSLKQLQKLFFTIDGRITRMQYSITLILPFLTIVLVLFSFGLINLFPLPEVIKSILNYTLTLTALLSILLGIILSFTLGIKRLHDVNFSGWFILINFIPMVSFALFLFLVFMPGTEGKNEYGK
jgi:uncharacterized membrane protein YhaH (DUF805 family)